MKFRPSTVKGKENAELLPSSDHFGYAEDRPQLGALFPTSNQKQGDSNILTLLALI